MPTEKPSPENRTPLAGATVRPFYRTLVTTVPAPLLSRQCASIAPAARGRGVLDATRLPTARFHKHRQPAEHRATAQMQRHAQGIQDLLGCDVLVSVRVRLAF